MLFTAGQGSKCKRETGTPRWGWQIEFIRNAQDGGNQGCTLRLSRIHSFWDAEEAPAETQRIGNERENCRRSNCKQTCHCQTLKNGRCRMPQSFAQAQEPNRWQESNYGVGLLGQSSHNGRENKARHQQEQKEHNEEYS